MWWVYNTGLYHWGHLNNTRSDHADCTQAAALFPLSPPQQPAASGRQPPNCWVDGALPYLIALDDVIDLPQVVAAPCFVADLQQHQAYFLLSQFSRSDSALPSSLKYTDRETEGTLQEKERKQVRDNRLSGRQMGGNRKMEANFCIPPLAEEELSSLERNVG